ncbi:conserved hypothetical protein [Oleispira antarctica RB-8]|uniref:Uncharacterized protein n=1 Tax=Oleispira antarctica RB-8 TaxID=698738 RepID=R4YQ75_OLEAN|nr:conserved hypothetical protein [Oleispira antarctica RB-8]
MKTSLTSRYFVLFIMLVLTTAFSIQVIHYDQAYLYDENQLMEHVQLLILLLVGIVFWLTAGEKNWDIVKSSSASVILLAYLGAALSFSFILREMSIKKSHIDWLIFFVDGQGFKIIMAMVWVPLLYKAYQFKSEYIEIVKKAILSPTALFLMAAVAFLAAGGLFDKEIIVVEYFRFYEEVLEMNGYGFMLLAALSFHRDMVLAVCDCEKSARRALESNEVEKHALEHALDNRI